MSKFSIPILFLIFNRPDTTKIAFQRIKELEPKYLYIAADGPRTGKTGEDLLCQQTRELVTSQIDWDCEVKTLFREVNLGCGTAVSSAINWFFNNVEMGIIIEDDIVPDISFFGYCEELLEKYKNDGDIISISGYNFDYCLKNVSYGFSRFMSMWGWATWKRAAVNIDYQMNHWKQVNNKKLLLYNVLKQDFFDLDLDWIDYWCGKFNLTATGEMDTWDYQWMYYQLNNKMFSIFPSVNLVKNIGFNENATHTLDQNTPLSAINAKAMDFPLKYPKTKTNEIVFEDEYIKKVWCQHESRSLLKIFKNFVLRLGYKLRIYHHN